VIGLVADGYHVDDKVARRAYRDFLRALRDRELMAPRVVAAQQAQSRLRRRSLRGWRLWLDVSVAERGLTAISAYGRRVEELGTGERVHKHQVLNDQVEAMTQVLRGDLFRWSRRDDFVNAVIEPPPRRVLDELHRRLSAAELRRVIAAADRDRLQAEAFGLGAVFLRFADEVLARAEVEGWSLYGDLEQTRRWHSVYREILFDNPVITARFVPFVISLTASDALEPALVSILIALAATFPDWRAMTLALYTWPVLAWGDWRSGADG
jgi:hypothetical protein